MSSPIDRIENQLQAFIENTLNRLPWRNGQPRLAAPITTALRSQLDLDPSSMEPLPDQFNFFMHPENCSAWEDHPEWQEWLARVILETAKGSNRTFVHEPEVRFIPGAELTKNDVRLVLSFQEVNVSSTAVVTPEADPIEIPAAPPPASPYLILDGSQIFHLKSTVTNIGRRELNDLVLPDPRISRDHAQIRIIHDECVLFDLNSTGGTFVNGNRITTYSLIPGDVITLAGVNLIFADESPRESRGGGTSPAQLSGHDEESA